MANLRQQGGIKLISGPWGDFKEVETFTCAHCNSIHDVPHKTAPENVGGFCKHCSKLICPACVAKGNCTPFEEKLLAAEGRYESRRALERML